MGVRGSVKMPIPPFWGLTLQFIENKQEAALSNSLRSTGDRTRTYDLHHVKVLLYQLSYLRMSDGQGWIRTIESKR